MPVRMSVWAQATDNDVLEGGVDDLVVVGNAVELLSLQVEEHMMTLQHAVSVGMCVVPPTCTVTIISRKKYLKK